MSIHCKGIPIFIFVSRQREGSFSGFGEEKINKNFVELGKSYAQVDAIDAINFKHPRKKCVFVLFVYSCLVLWQSLRMS